MLDQTPDSTSRDKDRDRHPKLPGGGDRPKRLPSRRELESEVVAACRRLAERAGVAAILDGDEDDSHRMERIERVAHESLACVEASTAERYTGKDWQRLLLRRQFVRGFVAAREDEIRRAIAALGTDGQAKLFEDIKRQLLPYSNPSPDPGAFFDPEQWDFAVTGAGGAPRERRLARLGLFRVMMQEQESVFAEGGTNLKAIAMQVQNDRRTRRPGAGPG